MIELFLTKLSRGRWEILIAPKDGTSTSLTFNSKREALDFIKKEATWRIATGKGYRYLAS